jgi:hypothetical protein
VNDPLLKEEVLESFVDVFTTIVSSEPLYPNAVLVLNLSDKVPYRIFSFGFQFEKANPVGSGLVMNKGNVVAGTAKGGDREGTAEVRVNKESTISRVGRGLGFGVCRFGDRT